jgi:hypothetical protein
MNRHLYGALIVVLLASCVSAPSDAQDKPSGNDGGGPGGQAVPAKTSGVSEVFRVAKPEMLMLLSHDGKHLIRTPLNPQA